MLVVGLVVLCRVINLSFLVHRGHETESVSSVDILITFSISLYWLYFLIDINNYTTGKDFTLIFWRQGHSGGDHNKIFFLVTFANDFATDHMYGLFLFPTSLLRCWGDLEALSCLNPLYFDRDLWFRSTSKSTTVNSLIIFLTFNEKKKKKNWTSPWGMVPSVIDSVSTAWPNKTINGLF